MPERPGREAEGIGEPQGPPLTAQEWDERYSGERVWSGNPNHALVAEVAGFDPGRALDIGCGEGADAVWLARRGWEVTALDISPRACALTRAAAERAGMTVTTVAAPLQEAPLGEFDLVSAMYPVLAADADRPVPELLARLVARGGTLLFVHHDFASHEGHGHGFPGAGLTSPEEVAAFFRGRVNWVVEKEERRERDVAGGAGAHHRADLVVRVRRER